MDLPTITLSIVLGASCLYIYLCFQGIFTVLMVDIGYYRVLNKFASIFFDPGLMKAILFQVINYLKDILVQLFICIVFLYWLSPSFRKRFFLSCVFLLIGAIIADYLIYLKYSNDFFVSVLSYTPFFDGIMISYLFNALLWLFVFGTSIILANFVKDKQSKKGKCY